MFIPLTLDKLNLRTRLHHQFAGSNQHTKKDENIEMPSAESSYQHTACVVIVKVFSHHSYIAHQLSQPQPFDTQISVMPKMFIFKLCHML